MEKYRCLCCGFRTLSSQGKCDICPVCFWEDEVYFTPEQQQIYNHCTTIEEIYKNPKFEDLLTEPSSANHNLTPKQARNNYLSFGACEKNMLPYVRKPLEQEK